MQENKPSFYGTPGNWRKNSILPEGLNEIAKAYSPKAEVFDGALRHNGKQLVIDGWKAVKIGEHLAVFHPHMQMREEVIRNIESFMEMKKVFKYVVESPDDYKFGLQQLIDIGINTPLPQYPVVSYRLQDAKHLYNNDIDISILSTNKIGELHARIRLMPVPLVVQNVMVYAPNYIITSMSVSSPTAMELMVDACNTLTQYALNELIASLLGVGWFAGSFQTEPTKNKVNEWINQNFVPRTIISALSTRSYDAGLSLLLDTMTKLDSKQQVIGTVDIGGTRMPISALTPGVSRDDQRFKTGLFHYMVNKTDQNKYIEFLRKYGLDPVVIDIADIVVIRTDPQGLLSMEGEHYRQMDSTNFFTQGMRL